MQSLKIGREELKSKLFSYSYNSLLTMSRAESLTGSPVSKCLCVLEVPTEAGQRGHRDGEQNQSQWRGKHTAHGGPDMCPRTEGTTGPRGEATHREGVLVAWSHSWDL